MVCGGDIKLFLYNGLRFLLNPLLRRFCEIQIGNNNKKKRTVVILGAGASIEFLLEYQGEVLSTNRLTHIVSEDLHNFIMYLEKFYDSKRLYLIKNFMFGLTASLRKFWGNNYNFEHLVHLVDIITDTYSSINTALSNSKSGFIPNIYLSMIDFFNGIVDPWPGNVLFDFPGRLRNYLLDYICRYHPPKFKNSYGKSDLCLWKSFILDLLKNGGLSIFSLNYDSLIYEVLCEINKSVGIKENLYIDTGVEIENLSLYNGCELLNLERIRKAENVFVPLHGSVHFTPSGNGVKFCRDCSYARKKREEIVVSRERKQDGSEDYNQIMITGLSKFDSVSKEPFSTFYLRLVKDIFEANRIVIIGYGGTDRHLNMLLKSPFCSAKEIHYVTILPESYVDGFSRLGDLSVNEFWFCRNFLPEDCFQVENQDLKITDKIFMKKRCFVYPKGTKYFLKNAKRFLES